MHRRAKSVVERSGRRRAKARGFTLIELMAVVAITGILAAVAVATLRKRAFASDVASAQVVVQSIAAAEEHYRAENQIYLNVSTPGAKGWYPTAATTNHKRMWGETTHADSSQWRLLGPDIRQ